MPKLRVPLLLNQFMKLSAQVIEGSISTPSRMTRYHKYVTIKYSFGLFNHPEYLYEFNKFFIDIITKHLKPRTPQPYIQQYPQPYTQQNTHPSTQQYIQLSPQLYTDTQQTHIQQQSIQQSTQTVNDSIFDHMFIEVHHDLTYPHSIHIFFNNKCYRMVSFQTLYHKHKDTFQYMPFGYTEADWFFICYFKLTRYI